MRLELLCRRSPGSVLNIPHGASRRKAAIDRDALERALFSTTEHQRPSQARLVRSSTRYFYASTGPQFKAKPRDPGFEPDLAGPSVLPVGFMDPSSLA